MVENRPTSRRTPYLLSAPAVLFVILFMALPLTLLARLSFCKPAEGRGFYMPGTWTLDGYAHLSSHTGRIVGFTASFAVFLAFLGLLLAYPVALFIHRLPRVRKTLALILVLLPKLGSAFVVIYGLILLLDASGPVNGLLLGVGVAEPIMLTRNLLGAVIGELYLIFPCAVVLLVIGLERIDPACTLAARGLGARAGQVFGKILLPLTLSDVVLTGQLCLIWGLGSFLGPLLMGSPAETTLSVEVQYQGLEFSHWPRAAVAAVLLLGCLLLALGLFSLLDRRQPIMPTASGTRSYHDREWSRYTWRETAWEALGWLGLLVLVAPVILSTWVSFSPGQLFHPPTREWSLRWYEEFMTSPRGWVEALGRSLLVAALTGLLAMGLALPLALGMARYSFPGQQLLSTLVLVPLGVPPLVLGMGLLPLIHALGLWGTTMAIVIGHGLISLPVTYLVLRAHLQRTNPDLELAARGLGASPWLTFRWVTWPLLWPALAGGFLIAFVLSLNEALLNLFLASPEVETLPRLIWPNLRHSLSPLVAVASAISTLATLFGVLGFLALQRGLPLLRNPE